MILCGVSHQAQLVPLGCFVSDLRLMSQLSPIIAIVDAFILPRYQNLAITRGRMMSQTDSAFSILNDNSELPR